MLQKIARLQTVALGLLVILSLLTAARWLPVVISFVRPQQVPTAGCPGEALHCIWKVVHGHVLYTDVTQIPFSTSFFNWLHYWIYGGVCRAVMAMAGLGDEWIPTIASTLSVVLSSLGAAFAALAFYGSMDQRVESRRTVAAMLGIAAFFGPLLIDWNDAPRPDAPALALEAAGMWMVVTTLRSPSPGRWRWVMASLLFYGAWAFRVINVGCLAGVMGWLLMQRRWRDLLLLVVPFGLLVTVTFVVGGKVWRNDALLGNAICPLGIQYTLMAARLALAKSPMIVAAVVVGAVSMVRSAGRGRDQPWLWVLMASIGLALLAGLKSGSNQNYWFSCHFAALGVLAQAWPAGASAQAKREWSGVLVTLSLLACAAVQAGYLSGYLRGADTHADARLKTLTASLKGMPGPVIVRGGYFENLPWITGQPQPFVYAFTYDLLRKSGIPLEHDGLGGLVRDATFGTIVLPADEPLDSPVDGASLDRYEVVKKDAYFSYFTRRH